MKGRGAKIQPEGEREGKGVFLCNFDIHQNNFNHNFLIIYKDLHNASHRQILFRLHSGGKEWREGWRNDGSGKF